MLAKPIPLLDPIRAELEKVEIALDELCRSLPEPLESMVLNSLDNGKRIRPALVILTGQAFDHSGPQFITLAVAVELLHTASLVHDDIVDGSSMRRGREAVHVTWSADAAVLAGDFLFAQAISLISTFKRPHILSIAARAVEVICRGEIRYLFSKSRKSDFKEGYFAHINAKTAEFFAATTAMACILADADDRSCEAMRSFGRNMGMCFQIIDDILDLTGDSVQLGKSTGRDLFRGLLTLPAILYREKVGNDDQVDRILAGKGSASDIEKLIENIRHSGSIEEAFVVARQYAADARGALANLPKTQAASMLHQLVDFVLIRDS